MKLRATCRAGLLLLLALAGGLAGCERPPAPQDEPIVVVVSKPLKRPITDYVDFSGQTEAVETVQVRPRVSGYLKDIQFKSGGEVKKGQILFVIDRRPYKAALDKAQAAVERAKAAVKRAEAEEDRSRKLVGSASISRADYERDVATASEARATVSQNKASLESAKLDYEWSEVRAEIDGKITRNELTKGNLVEKDKTLLATIVSQHPIWANFDVDDKTKLHFDELVNKGKLKSPKEAKFPVFLGMPNRQDYPYKGFIDYVAPKVKPGTGTVQARGEFPNKDNVIIPGLFVRIRVPVGGDHDAILVNENALSADQGQKYLLVVNDKNQVIRRNVTLGSLQNGLREIVAGLGPEERVITDGIQRVRPGVTVNPTEQPMPELPGAGGTGKGG
jgi:RND family efflux transporter MFP subunit